MSSRPTRAFRWAAWALCSLAACVEVPGIPNLPSPGADGGSTTSDGGFAFDAGPATTDARPPSVTITAPVDGASFASAVSSIVVEGTASDDVGIAAIHVSVGPNAPVPAASTDFFRSWRLTVPLPPGTFPVRARAVDAAGKATQAQIMVHRAPPREDRAPPTLTLLEPADGTRTTRQAVVLSGTAADDTGLALVEARVDGLGEYAAVETSDTFAHWRATLALAPGRENLIRVRATDIAGKRVERTVRVTSLMAADREPPGLTVERPRPGDTVGTETIEVRGTASDNLGVTRVEVRIGSGAWIPATTMDGFASWSATAPAPAVPAGSTAVPATLRVRATDVSDLETVITVPLTSTFSPAFDAPRDYELRLPAPRDRTVSLTLDRQGLSEVIPQSVRRSIVLLNLDPTALMTNLMETIKNQCGTGWERSGFTPRCPSSWRTPEINLWRLLTMTPDNVNVEGTSIAGVRDIADFLATFGVIDEFSQILADTLNIGRFQEIVDTATAVAALRDDLIRTHPKANADGTLPVTIEDGLSDMRTLGTTFGPSGAHPGFLDPAAQTFSQVLTPNFRMSVDGVSNLTWHDGIDLSQGKEYIALLPTPNSDVITFDFANTLTVSGLASNPTVTLTFVMTEHPQFLSAATRPNDQNAPPHPGLGAAWSASRWLIEYVLVDAAFRKYRTRPRYVRNYRDPIFGGRIAVITVGANDTPDPKLPVIAEPVPLGWARFWTLGQLGDPPPAQYLWEMIAEVSQVRLRDGGVPEGQGSVRFAVTNVPVGITAQQIVDQMRPNLEAQKSVLARRLLGDYRLSNGAVDFYLKGSAGNLYLFFVHETDPLPRAFAYARPGFFSDPALTQKVSTTAALSSGDAVHEKIRLGATAQTVFAQDDSGRVYRLEIQPARSDRVTIRVSRKR